MQTQPAPPSYDLTWQVIAAAGLALGAGVLHFVFTPTHLGAARGQGLFFLALGFLQVGWGATVLRHPSPRTYIVGLVAATTMPALIYVVGRFIAAPFGTEAEAIDIIGAAALSAEVLGAILLAWHGLRQGIQWRNPTIRPLALVLLLVLAGAALAGVLWGAGLATEGVDWLAEPETGGHSDGQTATGHHATADSATLGIARVSASLEALGS